MTFTPPTKRTHGQCSPQCHSYMASPERVGMNGHSADCPALYPLQPQPGDEPETLTRLTRLVRSLAVVPSEGARADIAEHALTLIAHAREERTALEGDVTRLMMERSSLAHKAKAFEDTERYRRDDSARLLKMGQQQGRAELAQELIAYLAPTAKE